MPFRRRASYGRRSDSRRPIDSNKNVISFSESPSTTIASTTLVLTKDSASNTVTNEVTRGCSINAIWLSVDGCGLASTGAKVRMGLYLIKDSGSNLASIPSVFAVGSSNEKKFIIKNWQYMVMRNQDGNPPFHWEGWIRIPKGMRRCGADDKWSLAFEQDVGTGHLSGQCIYKWYK